MKLRLANAGIACPCVRQRVGYRPAQLPDRFVGEDCSCAREPVDAHIEGGQRLFQSYDLRLKSWSFSPLRALPSVRTSSLSSRRFASTSPALQRRSAFGQRRFVARRYWSAHAEAKPTRIGPARSEGLHLRDHVYNEGVFRFRSQQ
jgi:hypothetical protein